MEKGRPGETYIIAGPRHTFVEGLQVAQEITGIPAPRAAPAEMFKLMAAVMGVVEQVLPVPEAYTGDNAKARRELGYNPRPLKAGLAETLRHEMELLGMKK